MVTQYAIEQALLREIPAELQDRVPRVAQVIADAIAGEHCIISDPRLVEAIRKIQDVELGLSQGSIKVGNINGTGIAIGAGSIAIVVNLHLGQSVQAPTHAGTVEFPPSKSSVQASKAEFLAILERDEAGTVQEIRQFLASNPSILTNWISWKGGAQSRCVFNVVCEDTVVDFAVGINHATVGQWEWKLVMLESPCGSYYTPEGGYTEHIHQAIGRASAIRQTLQLNLRQVRDVLPDLEPMAPVIMLSGRRLQISEADRKRVQLLKLTMPGFVLNTYDSLVDSWKEH